MRETTQYVTEDRMKTGLEKVMKKSERELNINENVDMKKKPEVFAGRNTYES